MIDIPDRVERLIARLRGALPLSAAVGPQLANVVREKSLDAVVPRECQITQVDYAGDEGGIMCRLDFGGAGGLGTFFVSITQLVFDRRASLAREIAAYQKHRIKRIRRLAEPGHPLQVHHVQ